MMNEYGIRSKVSRKHLITTDSKHDKAVADDLLKRDFTANIPNQKMVSDTTYIPTNEGWLFLAAIMDLCGDKIVGLATSDRNDQNLVIAALKDAKMRTKDLTGCILHSDRGATYCSNDYRSKLEEYHAICSMSRRGNCWDNAPMESFWGKLKLEWLDENCDTKAEARYKINEYVWFFYNNWRIHESNGYITPNQYYDDHKRLLARTSTDI